MGEVQQQERAHHPYDPPNDGTAEYDAMLAGMSAEPTQIRHQDRLTTCESFGSWAAYENNAPWTNFADGDYLPKTLDEHNFSMSHEPLVSSNGAAFQPMPLRTDDVVVLGAYSAEPNPFEMLEAAEAHLAVRHPAIETIYSRAPAYPGAVQLFDRYSTLGGQEESVQYRTNASFTFDATRSLGAPAYPEPQYEWTDSDEEQLMRSFDLLADTMANPHYPSGALYRHNSSSNYFAGRPMIDVEYDQSLVQTSSAASDGSCGTQILEEESMPPMICADGRPLFKCIGSQFVDRSDAPWRPAMYEGEPSEGDADEDNAGDNLDVEEPEKRAKLTSSIKPGVKARIRPEKSGEEFNKDHAPSVRTMLPPTVSMVEGLLAIPNISKRNRFFERCAANGASLEQVAAIMLRGRGKLSEKALDSRYMTIRKSVKEVKKTGFNTKMPITTYDTAGYVLRDTKRGSSEVDASLLSIANMMVEWPTGINRGQFTQALEWARATRNSHAKMSMFPALTAAHGWTFPLLPDGTPANQSPTWDQDGLLEELASIRASGFRAWYTAQPTSAS